MPTRSRQRPRGRATDALARGPRVYVRAPRSADAETFLAATTRSKRLHRPWIYAPLTRAAFDVYLERLEGDEGAGLFVFRHDDDALVGVFNLGNIVRGGFSSAYLGYYAFSPFEGRGYMAEGLALTLRVAFLRLRLHRVEANIQPENSPSRDLALAGGFKKEGFSPRYLKIGGRWRDHERWAITIEDWRRARR